ncbi:MAG: hypothetical protein NC111_03425 [Bacteroides sp.]|nr:hypothetical protein [Bacteroides sp.]MCM1412896.1 hypothetical protein [Bacteroides sp.]MCM1471565.1 hypothetical protein [Bacteroides sp.]
MKRLLSFILFSLFVVAVTKADSNIVTYRATDVSYSVDGSDEWTDWEKVYDTYVILNYNTDIIKVGNLTFRVKNYGEVVEDSKGKIFSNRCVDSDGDPCNIRIRIHKDGYTRLYIDYDGFTLCYALVD